MIKLLIKNMTSKEIEILERNSIDYNLLHPVSYIRKNVYIYCFDNQIDYILDLLNRDDDVWYDYYGEWINYFSSSSYR